ncbi:MAG: accessory factor UbiK family protein [Mariprofundaceae bacterium]
MAIDNALLDDLSHKIAGGLRILDSARNEAGSQVRSVVENALESFDVVTHERLQVQETMLLKAKEELVKLEQRVAELEGIIKEQDKGN